MRFRARRAGRRYPLGVLAGAKIQARMGVAMIADFMARLGNALRERWQTLDVPPAHEKSCRNLMPFENPQQRRCRFARPVVEGKRYSSARAIAVIHRGSENSRGT